MTKLADVIIVGGGIHGCSTALHMCLAGMKPVLIEKDYAGRHASGVNAGGVRQLARHIAEIPLSISSMALWEKIEELVATHPIELIVDLRDEAFEARARIVACIPASGDELEPLLRQIGLTAAP